MRRLLSRPLRWLRWLRWLSGAFAAGAGGRGRRGLHWRRLLARLPVGAALRGRLLASASKLEVYIASGRVDLADLNTEAARNNGPVPILFDQEYYLDHNADVRDAGIDPLRHYLRYGALEGRLPFAIDAEAMDPLTADLHRCDMQRSEVFAFHAGLYRSAHADLSDLDDAALRNHFDRRGKAEGRMCSLGAFLSDLCENPREIPLDFKADEYLGLYPDLQAAFGERPPLDALRHYMLSGRWEPRLHTVRSDADRKAKPASAAVHIGPSADGGRAPLCVLAHVYYADLWPELSGYLANLPADSHELHINLVDTTFTQDLLAEVRDDFPKARVYISPNIGRDIGGHVQMLRNIRIKDYPLYLLVHTKQSPHMSKGEVQLWRRKLLEPLLGASETAAANIRALREDASIGILGSERCRYKEIVGNTEKYFELLDRLNVKEDFREVDFVSGTMMFMRREVLARVAGVALELEPGDDQPLSFHRDGQWAHAVERVFAPVARELGYRVEWLR